MRSLVILFVCTLLLAACGDDTTTMDDGGGDGGAPDSTVDGAPGDAALDTAPPCPPPDPGGDATSFAMDVYPIIEMRCAPCHTLSESGGLAMLDAASAYCDLVNVESTCMGRMRVVPA